MPKVLIVDDDDSVRTIFGLYVQVKGDVDVEYARGPQEALGFLLEQEDITHVVSDLHMGREKMDGLQFAAYLRRERPDLKLYIHTANDAAVYQPRFEAAMKRGDLDGYGFKFGKPDSLVRVLDFLET